MISNIFLSIAIVLVITVVFLFWREISDELHMMRKRRDIRAKVIAVPFVRYMQGETGGEEETAHVSSLRSWQRFRDSIMRTKEKKVEVLRSQLPDALDAIASSIGSGSSLLQAIHASSLTLPQPIANEFRSVAADVAAGMSLGEALGRLRKNFPLNELDSLLIALELQHKSGGNIRELLAHAAQIHRDSAELRQTLRIKTAQARFSARMVAVLPIGLLLILSLFSSDYLSAFFSTPVGLVLLAVAIGMESLGYMLVKKLSEVDIV